MMGYTEEEVEKMDRRFRFLGTSRTSRTGERVMKVHNKCHEEVS